MTEKNNIYIVSNYRVGAADGLAEFNYQNVNLLKDSFNFTFIEFDNSRPYTFYESSIIDNFTIIKFGSNQTNPFQLPVLFSKLLESLQRENTVFHLHHIFNFRNYLISRLLVQNNLPYLITPHDSFVYGKDYRFSKPWFKRLYRDSFVKIFDKYVLDHANLIHGLTDQCPPYLKKITNSPIEVVLNQVSDMAINFEISAVKQQVCFIGRFDIFRKGIDLALQSFSMFKNRRNNNPDYKFILIGPASEIAKKQLTLLCNQFKLNLDQDVTFTGKVSVEERNKSLTESKVYMQLSRTEGFGLSIAQALSCYKPVIVSKNVPIYHQILKHNAGFATETPEQAADALENIFNLTEAAYLEMAMNARRCYEQEFHPSIIKPQLVKLYRNATSKSY